MIEIKQGYGQKHMFFATDEGDLMYFYDYFDFSLDVKRIF